MSNDTTKQCTKCLETFPATTEYFPPDDRNICGLRAQCRYCKRRQAKEYRTTHRTEISAKQAAYYAEHRAEKAEYRFRNRAKIAAKKAAYQAQHREEIAKYQAIYRTEHHEKMIEHHRNYYATHREELLSAKSMWGKANPEKVRAKWHRRHARKLAAGGTHTAEDVKRQGDCQKWRCWWCGKRCADEYHVDHMIPLNRGGHNNPSNIVISCPHCNLSKSDKMPDEFLGRLF